MKRHYINIYIYAVLAPFKEISRIYIQEHKEEIKEKKHERVICECGAELSRASLNQNRHKRSKQHLQHINSNTM